MIFIPKIDERELRIELPILKFRENEKKYRIESWKSERNEARAFFERENRGLTKTEVWKQAAAREALGRGEARSSRARPVLPDRRFTACISPSRVT